MRGRNKQSMEYLYDTPREMPGVKSLALAACALLIHSGVAFAKECTQPVRPALPDGAQASLEQMIAGQKAVKTFQAENMNYMRCLESNFTTAKTNAEASDVAVRTLAQVEYSAAIDAYNAAVSAEEEVAGAFNIELREFKAANR